MNGHLLTVDDLSDEDVAAVLARAAALAGEAPLRDGGDHLVGLVFLEASLRTRLGFAAAAQRLGWRHVDVIERRSSQESMPESWQDTLRTVSGYVDVLVARLGHPLNHQSLTSIATVPLLNAGSRGPAAEHPSQALIDLFAMQRMRGPIGELHVAICGDLRMRSARSLIALLARRLPRRLSLITHADLGEIPSPPGVLGGRMDIREPWQLEGVDVLYVAGIPHGAVTNELRTRLRIDRRALEALAPDAVVLSPLPIIDEVASAVRGDPRMRYFEQSDAALFVRMALLQLLAGTLTRE